MNQEYTLYGAPFSLYTGKARSYLHYKGIKFVEKLATLRVYKKIIIPKTGVRFIPVLKTPEDTFIQDTAVIIDELESRFPQRPVMPNTPKQRIVSQLFELYGDEWLLLPAMHYRWNKGNDAYIYANFGSIVIPGWPRFLQRIVGKKVGAKFKGFVPRLGILPETIPALEHWYEVELLPLLDSHFEQHNYLLGDAASIGDFGLMGSLYAHLYMDPYPGELMKRLAPNVVKWIERMNKTPKEVGSWLANDEIPATLAPILSLLFRDHWPVVASTVNKFNLWAQQTNPEAIPRTIGKLDFKIDQTISKRSIQTFTLWKLQRILDAYALFNNREQSQITEYLNNLGANNPFDLEIIPPVERRFNKLVLK
jgi:glutathione S-transferase